MQFLVCVKQVPEVDQVRFDRANRVVRADVPSLCNPLDMQALGHALQLRAAEDEVVVVTMGPPAARAVLEDALHRGADRAIHLTDRRFQGADTLATARALAEVVHRETADVVLFGRSTLDGATAQLGQQVAELAQLHQLTEVVQADLGDGGLRVGRETERGHETWQAPLPVLLTVARGPQPPEIQPPEIQSRSSANVVEITAEDLGGKPVEYGTRGSPTFVRQVRDRDTAPRGEFVDGGVEAAAERVHALVADVGERARGSSQLRQERAGGHEVWVLAERDGDELDQVSFEGLACADHLAQEVGARVTALLLDAADDGASTELAMRGADRVVHARLRDNSTHARADALSAVLSREQPLVLVAPWTARGRDCVPRVAARLGLGLTGDVTGVEVEPGENPRIQWVKPAWAGTAEALVISRTTPSVATLRPGAYRPLEPRAVAGVEVDTVDVELSPVPNEPQLISSRRDVDDCPLDRAPVVFCVGAEVSAAAAAQVLELARAWGAGVGGTAEAVRQGRVPSQWELGVLKRSIAPEVCLALGVREVQEVAAVRGTSTLVTVHPDIGVPAHDRADLQVVAGVEPLVKALAARAV